uniref:CMP-N-acetylneuraminate-beta-galactosamide-alpha-2,3-sialyltransferase 1-like n=1 Tax=Xiphophorus maculatus TaxID=8083 RepID=A0A3B5PVT0_XIPMA
FLGHVVSKKGRSLSPKCVSAVQNIPRRVTKKQLLSFLGITSYSRNFILNYSILENPLRALSSSLQAPDTVQWTPEAELTQKRLFEIFPSFPIFGKPTADRIRSCAVVGNSVNLKGSGYGRLIDSHEVIIRMNFGPVKGYEEDVGTKTTHRAMYPESAMDLDNCTHLVLFPFKINDIEWIIKAFTTGFYGRSYAPIKSKIKANKNLVLVVNPAFMKYAHEIWLEKMGSYPSTGFMTFLLTLHVCDEVHVFGFGADNKGSWKHYWETLQNKNFKTGLHPGPHEYKIIQRLADGKTIKLYKGS